jgi:hypothetical protein
MTQTAKIIQSVLLSFFAEHLDEDSLIQPNLIHLIWTSGLICRSQFVCVNTHLSVWANTIRTVSLSIHLYFHSKATKSRVDEQRVKKIPSNVRREFYEFAVECLVRLVAAALAASLLAAVVSIVVEVGDDDRVGRARPRDAVTHCHQNNLHAAVKRVEVRLPQDRRQRVALHRLAHQTAQLFGSVVEPVTSSRAKLDLSKL